VNNRCSFYAKNHHLTKSQPEQTRGPSPGSQPNNLGLDLPVTGFKYPAQIATTSLTQFGQSILQLFFFAGIATPGQLIFQTLDIFLQIMQGLSYPTNAHQ
jgi:hypothetical protein